MTWHIDVKLNSSIQFIDPKRKRSEIALIVLCDFIPRYRALGWKNRTGQRWCIMATELDTWWSLALSLRSLTSCTNCSHMPRMLFSCSGMSDSKDSKGNISHRTVANGKMRIWSHWINMKPQSEALCMNPKISYINFPYTKAICPLPH